MKIMNLKENYEKAIEEAARVIKDGGLVIFPTDTVYILAVDPANQAATDKLIGFKNRWAGKAISVAVADEKMADEYVVLNERIKKIMANLLPGPFTLVIEGRHKMAKGIEAENGSLGIRIPDNKPVADLVKELNGPVTATSANLSGRTPHYSVESLFRTLSKVKKEMIDLVIDAGKLPKNKPSTVMDISSPDIKILRRGDLITGDAETLVSKSVIETEKIAEYLFKKIEKKASPDKAIVLALSGDLGCGKTVFSRALGKYLGVKEKIVSPTFVIYNEYQISLNPSLTRGGQNLKTFKHFDLYRLNNEYEFEEIKFGDQFKPEVLACIEWPENMGDKIWNELKEKTNYFGINFKYINETTREIKAEI